MSVPEFAMQRVVEMSWDFLCKHLNYLLGQYLKELSSEKRDRWKTEILEELESGPPPVYLEAPQNPAQLPFFTIKMISENESKEGSFLGNVGSSNRKMPFPQVGMEDRRAQLPMDGAAYNDDTVAMFLGVDGQQMQGFPTNFRPTYDGDGRRKKGYNMQTAFSTTGDEQYERMGIGEPLFHMEENRILETVTGDQVTMQIIVSAGNVEKTIIYFRMLRWVMRRFAVWMHVNGMMIPQFSGGGFRKSDLAPSTGNVISYERPLTVTFLHYDVDWELESVLAEFFIDLEMATRRQDGTLDFTPLATTSIKAGFVDEDQDGVTDS